MTKTSPPGQQTLSLPMLRPHDDGDDNDDDGGDDDDDDNWLHLKSVARIFLNFFTEKRLLRDKNSSSKHIRQQLNINSNNPITRYKACSNH